MLLGAGASSALAVLLTVGQTVPFLRRVSVFGVRDGDGPQDLPVNRTARAAGAVDGATDPDFALELRHGDRSMRLTRAELAALPQRTHRLPIACVEGWSRNATWTGVAVADLVALVGAEPASVVTGPLDADPGGVLVIGAARRLRRRPAHPPGARAQR